LFAKDGKRCRENLCVGVCLFYILNKEVLRKVIVEMRKINSTNNNALRHPEVEGTRVPIRYDPFNIGIAYAYVRGQWVRCISQYYAAFQGHSEKELELATEVLRQQARINHKAVSLTPQRLADFLADVHAHQRVLAQRLRDQEAQGVLECLEADTARKPPEAIQPAFLEAFSLEPVDLAALPVFEEYR
jgi:putative transposase